MRFQSKSGAKYRVLIVDDDQTSLTLASTILNDFGFMVDTADTGQDAFFKCRETRYDLIFMDIEMPGMNGYQTSMAIRGLSHGSCNAYIIALSGAIRTKEQLNKCMESKMNNCMAKPIRTKTLEKQLIQWQANH